jgi:hypothetical protein
MNRLYEGAGSCSTLTRSVSEVVKKIPRLRFGLVWICCRIAHGHLDLSDTNVTDEGLKELGKLKHLQWLVLARTKVTDEGLAHLTQLKELRMLIISGTKVTAAGVADFEKAMLRWKCKVVHLGQ